MLTLLDAEGMKKNQLHVENMDGVSPYFNNLTIYRLSFVLRKDR